MEITSYFIAVDLKIEKLKKIFLQVEKFLKSRSLDKDIILQNYDTPHITLYYLNKNCDYKNIKYDLIKFKSSINHKIFIKDFSYFYRYDKEFICYLKPSSCKDFSNYHIFFNWKYKDFWAIDNDLDFIPHISLFKILDNKLFLVYKTAIENFIKNEIENLNELDINNYSISLYGVNSNLVPELQFKI